MRLRPFLVAGTLARGSKRRRHLARVHACSRSLTSRRFGETAALLFEVFGQRYERGSTLVTSNLPLDEWTSIFGSERLTGALLDRLTHHVHIPEMNGENYRLATSKRAQRRSSQETNQNPKSTNDGIQKQTDKPDHTNKSGAKALFS
jgi:hypothetical protein